MSSQFIDLREMISSLDKKKLCESKICAKCIQKDQEMVFQKEYELSLEAFLKVFQMTLSENKKILNHMLDTFLKNFPEISESDSMGNSEPKLISKKAEEKEDQNKTCEICYEKDHAILLKAECIAGLQSFFQMKKVAYAVQQLKIDDMIKKIGNKEKLETLKKKTLMAELFGNQKRKKKSLPKGHEDIEKIFKKKRLVSVLKK